MNNSNKTIEEVLKKIQKAKENSKKKLTLTNLGLTKLPIEIVDLVNLDSLNLRGNKIISLPPEIEKLSNLTKLNLSNNQLSDFAPEISKLKNLTILNLRGNHINKIPGEIANLTNLLNLDLSKNRLENLPYEICLLKNIRKLNVSENYLSEFPQLFSNLTNLNRLFISKNMFTEIPYEIFKLLNLIELGVSRNKISLLLPEIGELINLRHLDISENNISELPSEIALLKNLVSLNIANNKISMLPTEIANLISLTRLDLRGNRLTSIQKDIFKIEKLNRLYLSMNQITSISPEIGNLSNISKITLGDNLISSLPPEIFKIPKLTKLDLSNNQIKILPKDILNMNLQIVWEDSFYSNIWHINLYGNPLESPPINIIKQGREAIKIYFNQIEEYGASNFINEARVLIVGEPKSGKTTLLKKILDPNYKVPDPNQEETLGVTIQSFKGFPITDHPNRSFTTHVWDFGGQNIQYHLHQFFLSDRSLYILLLDDRKECPTLDYWFNIIKILGEGSPILVVLNKINKTAISSFDFNKYKDRYSEITMEQITIDFSKNDHYFECLIKQIQTMILSLKHLQERLPSAWPKVRDILISDQYHGKNTIEWREFQKICEMSGLKNEQIQLVLSGYFHSLGLIQHFRNDSALFSTVFLNPEWLTRAVYTILSDPSIPENKGTFTRDWLFNKWGTKYSIDEKHKLLRLMQKKEFDLCYEYTHKGQKLYLTPDLLPNIEPEEAKGWEKIEKLSFRYQYPFMPQGLIGRLIVRLNEYIEFDNNGAQLVWKSGAILKKENIVALIRENLTKRGEKIIEIHTRAGKKHNRREFLTQIRGQLELIHKEYFPHMNVIAQIPCICETCQYSGQPHPFPLSNLVLALEMGKSTMECGISLDAVPVDQLSGEYFLPDELKKIKNYYLKFEDNSMKVIYHNEGQATIMGPNAKAGGNILQQNLNTPQEKKEVWYKRLHPKIAIIAGICTILLGILAFIGIRNYKDISLTTEEKSSNTMSENN